MSDVGIMLVLFVGVMGTVALIRFLAWLTDLKEAHGSVPRAGLNTVQRYVSVKHSQRSASDVMSRSEDVRPVESALSLQTDSRQTADKPPPVSPSRDVMLNTYRLLRKYGIPREEARPVLKAAGLPLDNNLWADAAPPDDVHRTPIVGRATSARFETTDPDYPYQSPA